MFPRTLRFAFPSYSAFRYWRRLQAIFFLGRCYIISTFQRPLTSPAKRHFARYSHQNAKRRAPFRWPQRIRSDAFLLMRKIKNGPGHHYRVNFSIFLRPLGARSVRPSTQKSYSWQRFLLGDSYSMREVMLTSPGTTAWRSAGTII